MTPVLREILFRPRAVVTPPVTTTPLFLGAGNTDRGNISASNTHPTFTTSIDAPIGSTIMVAVYTNHNDAITGFTDSGGNSYTAFGSVVGTNFLQAVCFYRSGILVAKLAAGATMGPTLTDNGNLPDFYGAAMVFPGVTALDPEANSIASDITGATMASATIPANTTFPQYAGVMFWSSTQTGNHFAMDAAYTDVLLDHGLDSDFGSGGDFGLRGFVKKLTSAGGPYTAANNYDFGVGPHWASGQATVTVSS